MVQKSLKNLATHGLEPFLLYVINSEPEILFWDLNPAHLDGMPSQDFLRHHHSQWKINFDS